VIRTTVPLTALALACSAPEANSQDDHSSEAPTSSAAAAAAPPVRPPEATETSSAVSSPEADGVVQLHWQIDSAEDNFGFYLERNGPFDPLVCPTCHLPHLREPDPHLGEWVRVNQRLIPGVGTTSEVHRFDYEDTGLVRGKDYLYNLYEVSMDGRDVLKGTVPAHCRTEEEQAFRERRANWTEILADTDDTGETVTSPQISGEWVTFFYPRERTRTVHLIGDWMGWEENPLPLERVPDTFWLMVDVPLEGLPDSIEHLYLVGDPGSIEVHLDPGNPTQAHSESRGEIVSVFGLSEAN
jgi:hypothetical protein